MGETKTAPGRPNKFYECGTCGHYHRSDFLGLNADCRNDAERFTTDEVEAIVGDDWGSKVAELQEIPDERDNA